MEQLTHGTTQVQKAPIPVPSPPIPVPGHLGDRPPTPRQALTHIVILEGMEKVASQLPVVSWSARGIANATYVVWRILWGTGREVVSRTMPWGRTQPCPPQSHSPCLHQGHSSNPVLRRAHTPTLQPTPLTFGSPSMSPDPAERGEKGEEPYWACSHGPVPPTAPLISTQRLCFEHCCKLGADPRVGTGSGTLCQCPQGRKDHRGSPNDPFMWWGSIPPMPPMGPSEPGPIGNCGRKRRQNQNQPQNSSKQLPQWLLRTIPAPAIPLEQGKEEGIKESLNC